MIMTRYATPYGAYEIDSVPGQPQIAHCHSLFVKIEHRGQGLGHALKAHQMQTLHALGYNYATCTIDYSNYRQHEVLTKAGWHMLQNINNSRTGNCTQLWGWHVKESK
jgi:GNAT superfamily N-acetyltransferase